MDSNRDFAHVESEVRKHQNIYTVHTYRDIMSSCMRSSQPKITAKWHDTQKQKPYILMTLLDFYDNLTCSVNEDRIPICTCMSSLNAFLQLPILHRETKATWKTY